MSVSTLRFSLFAVLVSILAACSDRDPDTGSGNDAATAAAPETSADVVAVPASDTSAVVSTPPRYRFGFTPVSEEEDPRIVEWAEDPCGVTAIAEVDRMPVEDPTLLPDFVVEFDAVGVELRRWAKPYSAEIVEIAGERLHFRADHEGRDRVFWTQPDGALGVIDEGLANPAAAPVAGFADGAAEVECPVLTVFADSDYVQCYEITDGAGVRRRVAFEGACS